MDLQPYIEGVRHQLAVAAAASGAEAAELAERLTAPLESAIRLALLEALSDASELITRDLAPGSVEVRLRGRDPDFAVDSGQLPPDASVTAGEAEEDGGTWRVTLRVPEHLRHRVDAAARGDGLSVNAWLVRAIAAALRTGRPARTDATKNFSGWVR